MLVFLFLNIRLSSGASQFLRCFLLNLYVQSVNALPKPAYHIIPDGGVADRDPVGPGPFWSDPDLDPDVRDRILILALINEPKSAFLVFNFLVHV
jgi:hypothetical protein